ncbi:hypothetical protein MHBO_004279 [Bonamia ostreae]|uniref:Uncharacterized protein n=1 Tax=Bonamia ostreae TaxID=126728 RepID=A0ABV2ASY0_9EUKA
MARWPPQISQERQKAQKDLLDNAGMLSIHLRDPVSNDGTRFLLQFGVGEETIESKLVDVNDGKPFSDHLKLNITNTDGSIKVRMFTKGLFGRKEIGRGDVVIDEMPNELRANFFEGRDVAIFVNFDGKGARVTYNFQKIDN